MNTLPLLADVARGAVILGVALAAMPLLRRAPASTRRLVLAFALAASLVAPAVARVAPSWRVVPAAELPVFGEPVAEEIVDAPAAVAAAPAHHATPGSHEATRESTRGFPWAPALLVVWLLGFSLVLGRLVLGLVRARGIARRASCVRGWPLHAMAAAEEDAGVRASVRVSDEVDAPAVTGLANAVILMPRAALTWTPARWRVVLLHELAHVRQRDCLAQVVAQLACAVRWFDPLAWLAARRMRLERELAADERVLASGARPTTYAEHLLAIAADAARGVPTGALGMAQPSELARRVEAIVRAGAAHAHASRKVTVAIAASTVALLAAVACATPESRGPSVAQFPSAAAASTSPSHSGALVDEVAAMVKAPAAHVELAIDPGLQSIVDEEMARLVAEWHPAAATAIVLEPSTGRLLALSDPSTARRAYVPGSTLKAVAFAAALDVGAVSLTERVFCDNGARSYGKHVLHDSRSFGWLELPQVLATSSNVGASKVYDKLGGARFGDSLRRFHFGEVPSVELPGAASGAFPIAMEDGSFDGAVVAIGEGMTASPIQMVAAYGALANDGVYNAPTLVRREPTRERLIRSETARAVMSLLEAAVNDELATGKAARVQGVRVAGKTGTADWKSASGEDRYYASFIGALPAERPRFVILVGADIPADSGSGGTVAAPVFARIAARAIAR